MSDEADFAADRIEKELEARRAEAQRQSALAALKPLPVYCRNGCGERARERSPYCSADCRDEAELRERQLRRSGRL